MSIESLLEILLEEDDPPAAWALVEASVHLGTRGKTFTASFRDETGEQVWKSTGMTDRQAALALARKWEADAKRKRATQGDLPKKPTIRVRRGSGESALGLFSQAEVAAILRVSERTVRATEQSAFQKLRNHPSLKEFWREWQGGQVEEAAVPMDRGMELSHAEIAALLALARTPTELRALKKLIALTRT